MDDERINHTSADKEHDLLARIALEITHRLRAGPVIQGEILATISEAVQFVEQETRPSNNQQRTTHHSENCAPVSCEVITHGQHTSNASIPLTATYTIGSPGHDKVRGLVYAALFMLSGLSVLTFQFMSTSTDRENEFGTLSAQFAQLAYDGIAHMINDALNPDSFPVFNHT